jgi:hypothetical protein
VDRQLRALIRDENDHLEQVPCTIWTDGKPAVWILSGILDSERMVNCVADVLVGDAVLAGRRMDLHEDLVYYESEPREVGDRLLAKTSLARPIQR